MNKNKIIFGLFATVVLFFSGCSKKADPSARRILKIKEGLTNIFGKEVSPKDKATLDMMPKSDCTKRAKNILKKTKHPTLLVGSTVSSSFDQFFDYFSGVLSQGISDSDKKNILAKYQNQSMEVKKKEKLRLEQLLDSIKEQIKKEVAPSFSKTSKDHQGVFGGKNDAKSSLHSQLALSVKGNKNIKTVTLKGVEHDSQLSSPDFVGKSTEFVLSQKLKEKIKTLFIQRSGRIIFVGLPGGAPQDPEFVRGFVGSLLGPIAFDDPGFNSRQQGKMSMKKTAKFAYFLKRKVAMVFPSENDRAKSLEEQSRSVISEVEKLNPNKKHDVVLIVGHGQGGLKGAFVLDHFEKKGHKNIASIFVGTPFEGSRSLVGKTKNINTLSKDKGLMDLYKNIEGNKKLLLTVASIMVIQNYINFEAMRKQLESLRSAK